MEILKQALIAVGAVGLFFTFRITIWPRQGEDIPNKLPFRPDLFDYISILLAYPLIEEIFFRGIPLLFAGLVLLLGGGEMGRIIIYALAALAGNIVWVKAHDVTPHAKTALLIGGFLFVYLAYVFGIWAAILGHATWNTLCIAHAVKNQRTLI